MKRLQVLYADDDRDDLFMFENALKDLGLSVNLMQFNSGIELMELIKQNVIIPDLIFLDINMPGMNGFECLVAIKKIDGFSNVPVIILSTSNGQRSKELAMELGATSYLCKPESYSLLRSEIGITLSEYL